MSTAGQLSEICRCQSGKYFPLAPQVQLSFYQQTYYLIAAGEQYWELGLLGSRRSGGSHSWTGPRRHFQLLLDARPVHQPQISSFWFTQHRYLGEWEHGPSFTVRSIFPAQLSGNLRCSVLLFFREALAE